MSNQSNIDPTRRNFLMNAGSGLLAAGAANVPLAPPDKEPPNLPVPGPKSKKLGWAIVGLGQLALEQVMPAFAEAELSQPVALVSGHPEKAKKVAEHYSIDPKNIYGYENYDSIKDDPRIDIVYIILPNSMHAEYTIRALKAGKHVLCEKPMAPSVEECQKMIDAAKAADRKLMIAYRLRYEPYNQAMIEMARKQAYGKLQIFSAENVQDVKAPNIRLSKSTGGGAMGDVGIYCLNAARYITGEEPTEVSAMMWSDPSDERFREVEQNVVFTLRFPGGVLAHCSAGFSEATRRRYSVFCTDGWMELDPAFDYNGLRLHVGKEKTREEIKLPEVKQFAKEMDHFSHCVMENKQPWTPGEEGLRDMKIIQAIHQSAKEGKSIKLT